LIYCRSGKRSHTIAELLRAQGYPKVTNVLGGIIAWTDKNYPTIAGK